MTEPDSSERQPIVPTPRRPPRSTSTAWRMRGLIGRWTGPDWLIAVLFAVGMAFLGGALGILPDLAAEGWSAGTHRLPLLWLYGVCAVGAILLGSVLWWQRNRVLRLRGTAYIVAEQAAGWQHEETESFLAAVRARFAAVCRVPGPADLGDDWNWPLDRRTDEWDRRVDELVRYFWATYFNDDHITANAIYVWAPWPVATAFGHRAVRGRRGLVLQVRQRPSFGRSGAITKVDFAASGHTFRSADSGSDAESTAPLPGTVSVDRRSAAVRVERLPNPAVAPAGGGPEVILLLVRAPLSPYGPLPGIGGGEPQETVPFHIADGAGLELERETAALVYQWCYQPPSGTRINWVHYPRLVDLIANWICQRAAAHRGATLLLGASIPQEVATGLGIRAAERTDWPQHLWPLVYTNAPAAAVRRPLAPGSNQTVPGRALFVVPDLDLGSGDEG